MTTCATCRHRLPGWSGTALTPALRREDLGTCAVRVDRLLDEGEPHPERSFLVLVVPRSSGCGDWSPLDTV